MRHAWPGLWVCGSPCDGLVCDVISAPEPEELLGDELPVVVTRQAGRLAAQDQLPPDGPAPGPTGIRGRHAGNITIYGWAIKRELDPSPRPMGRLSSHLE